MDKYLVYDNGVREFLESYDDHAGCLNYTDDIRYALALAKPYAERYAERIGTERTTVLKIV